MTGSLQLREYPGEIVHLSCPKCGADRLMAQDWTENLTPDEAQAALDVLAAHKGPLTVREAVEVRKLKLALQAKAKER